jgi:hypothetical protein
MLKLSQMLTNWNDSRWKHTVATANARAVSGHPVTGQRPEILLAPEIEAK